jgi:carbon storage regulator
MLVLSRKPNESLVIDGRIVIKVLRVEGEAVKIGIQAPADVPVYRQEVYEEIQRNNRQAATRPQPVTLRLAPRTLTKQETPQKPAAVSTCPA